MWGACQTVGKKRWCRCRHSFRSPILWNVEFDDLKRSVNTRHESIFCEPQVVRDLSCVHENCVIVPADKASNNYTFVCRKYYVSILIEELGHNSLPLNPTYNLTDFSASEVLSPPLQYPDSTHTLAQRWANVVHFVGPTLAFNVGPTL